MSNESPSVAATTVPLSTYLDWQIQKTSDLLQALFKAREAAANQEKKIEQMAASKTAEAPKKITKAL